ncbi:MAG: GNAT family N-acetyltransferase [Thermoanaerobaculum sp.]|nr:GNAT family N-acetyltransferase [Thermoanaerobaculum sp.]
MELRLLRPPVDPAFLAMTFPAYRHLLQQEVAPKLLGESGVATVQGVAVGGFAGPKPVALALLALPVVQREAAELLSVYVVPEFRRQGWGRRLVLAAEAVVRHAGYSQLVTLWTEGSIGSSWWQRVAQDCGWELPQRRTLSVRFTAEQALRFPWLDRLPVREGCEIVPLASVTPEELEALKASQQEKPWIAEDLVPWRYLEQGFEERTSLALRSTEGIMGWVINHALSPEWLRFTCSFIRKDWGRRGRILPLFSRSIHLMVEAGFTQASFVAPVRHATMVQFVERHLAPWAAQARWTWASRKVLCEAPLQAA